MTAFSLLGPGPVDKLVTYMSYTDGRDVAVKCLQEVTRSLAYYTASHASLSQRLKYLSAGAADGRKIIRLAKFFGEYVKLKQLSTNKGEDFIKDVYQFISYCSLFIASICESLSYFSKIRVIDLDSTAFTKRMNKALLLSSVTNLLMEVRNLKKEKELENISQAEQQGDEYNVASVEAKLSEIRAKKAKLYLSIIRFSLDIVTLSNALGLLKKYVGKSLNEGVAAIMAFVSAVIVAFNFYQLKVKQN